MGNLLLFKATSWPLIGSSEWDTPELWVGCERCSTSGYSAYIMAGTTAGYLSKVNNCNFWVLVVLMLCQCVRLCTGMLAVV